MKGYTVPEGMKLIISIVDRGVGAKVKEILKEIGCTYHFVMLGRGTANQEILDMLGLGIIEKDIVMAVIDQKLVGDALNTLKNELDLDEPGHGIACSLDLCSVGGVYALQIFTGQLGRKE